jgi:uncharacterized membrane protein
MNIPTVNNNPGDLRNIGQEGATQGAGGFAKFPTPQEGFGALLNDLQHKIKTKPNATLADFSNTYAPPSDGNDSAGYTAKLANQLKVPPNAPLSSLQPKIGQFAEAVAKNEGYQSQDPQLKLDQSTKIPGQDSSPNFMNYLLGGAAAVGGYALSHAKPLASAALTDVGAGLGATFGNAPGAIAGGAIGSSIGNALGLNDKTQTAQPTSGVLNQTPTNNSQQGIDTENTQDIQRIQDMQKATHALSETLQTTPTGKLLASMPQTQEALGYMSTHGFLPDTSSGVNDFTGAMKQNSNSRGELSNGIAEVLDIGKEQAPLEQVRQNAYKNIEKYADVREQPQQKALVDKELEVYKNKYGDTVSLGNMERSKREQGQAKGDWQKDTPSRNGHKALYGAFRDTITGNTKHKDLYEKTMKEETKSFQADKLMKKMHGKKALEHKGILRGVLKSYGKYVGTYLGDKIGGPLGAIVGTMVGDYVSKRVDKKFGKTFFESKEGQKLMELVGKKNPRVAKMLKDEILRYGNEAEASAKKEVEAHDQRLLKGLLLTEPSIKLGGRSKLEGIQNRTESEKQKYETKKEGYKEKKKGLLGNHDENTKNPYTPIEELPNIVWGKPATPKKKKPQKGLLTIR